MFGNALCSGDFRQGLPGKIRYSLTKYYDRYLCISERTGGPDIRRQMEDGEGAN